MTTKAKTPRQLPSNAPVSAEAAEILARPYARMLELNPDGLYTARILELPGTVSEGATPDEAMARLDEAFTGVLEVMLEYGDPIPEPIAATEYSGRLNLRIPPTLHADCARLAAAMDISLNRFLSDAIARHVGDLTGGQR